MSSSEAMPNPGTATTEITLVTGDRFCVEGASKDVERLILDAARGSLMQLARLIDAETGAGLAVNPEFVVLLRPIGTETG
jgi:hypothetical protein